MKAFGYEKFGDPDVFQTFELPEPTLKTATDVKIKTLAVGLNNFERSQRAGDFGGGKFPLIPGRDIVGEVVKTGDDVQNVATGDIVIGHGGPAYAEYAVLPAQRVVIKPESATVAEAVTLVTPGITAYNAATVFTQVKPGNHVFVNGATGGVGALAAQIAKNLGAYVIGTGSSRNLALLEELPLDEIGLYDKDDLAEKFANSADVVINAAMNGNNGELLGSVIKDGGQAASVGGDTDFGHKQVAFEHIRPLNAEHDQTALTNLAKMLGEGTLAAKIFKELPLTLDGVIEGHKLLEQHHAPGRVVLLAE
ncbi:NADP-dependent oxidoreductase [Secundilactobacillus collinoides]|uniref:NADP-dependent oxidoreductase n=1 Tax=Secundilactobacillus collinoides TaxID=33960 RepID=UPI0006D1FFDC|nr:NADP-dependent oxidoreductase [Secundilactobacillus collinoides]